MSIFASVSHADLDGHLPKIGHLEWKMFPSDVSTEPEPEEESRQVVAVTFCPCGCETLAVADSFDQVGYIQRTLT